MSNKTVSNILTVWFTILISTIMAVAICNYLSKEHPKSCSEISSDFMGECMDNVSNGGLNYAYPDECEESRRRIALDCREERRR